MSMKTSGGSPLANSIGFASPPIIKSLSVVPDTPFYVHEIPPGYIALEEALKAYHSHCLAYELNKNGRSILVSMDELRLYINNGTIGSFHSGPNGRVRILDAKDWAQDGPIITRVFKEKHLYTTLDEDGERRVNIDENVWLPFIPIISEDGNEISGHVIVLIEDLIGIINNSYTVTNSSDPANQDEVRATRRGAPRSHDSSAFLLEAFKIFYSDGAPRTMGELIQKSANAYLQSHNSHNGFSKTPGETWMKDCVRPLWHWIEEERKGR